MTDTQEPSQRHRLSVTIKIDSEGLRRSQKEPVSN